MEWSGGPRGPTFASCRLSSVLARWWIGGGIDGRAPRPSDHGRTSANCALTASGSRTATVAPKHIPAERNFSREGGVRASRSESLRDGTGIGGALASDRSLAAASSAHYLGSHSSLLQRKRMRAASRAPSSLLPSTNLQLCYPGGLWLGLHRRAGPRPRRRMSPRHSPAIAWSGGRRQSLGDVRDCSDC